jgi:hypothetical protein
MQFSIRTSPHERNQLHQIVVVMTNVDRYYIVEKNSRAQKNEEIPTRKTNTAIIT